MHGEGTTLARSMRWQLTHTHTHTRSSPEFGRVVNLCVCQQPHGPGRVGRLVATVLSVVKSNCWLKLAFHDADTDTDILAWKSRISDIRMYGRVGRVGVGVGVGAVECELSENCRSWTHVDRSDKETCGKDLHRCVHQSLIKPLHRCSKFKFKR